MPSPNVTLVRAAVTSPFKKAGRPGATVPAGRAVLPAAPVAPGPLASYSRICGCSDPGTLPLAYPHVLGFPLAMRLMTARRFPLPVIGLVHTWIEITCHRVLHPTDLLELTVYTDGLAPHRRGTEVTMVTEARIAGELVWESRSGYLSRHATDAAPTAADAAPADVELPVVAEWSLPGNLGRRYGAASGDRNPIHLYPLTARLFGFPRAIAHGMWTVARCLAEAPRPHEIRWVRADFRAPVLLPSTVTYAADSTGFQLRGASRVHLTGRMLGAPGPQPGQGPGAATDGRS
ncbi:MaoC family dehydratase [Streptomyces sp. NBC_01217]|uniref:MaoC family dehydratase n=1 Tax=Streptomyces sp. NBC_01217 TaxID=2903779 RepID=UPI002E0E2E03|nr:MaoC/PaaZ C-terminal domain-containing protein [Streptomyces sp. NBC_01217]